MESPRLFLVYSECYTLGVRLKCLIFSLFRVEVDWDLSLYGLQEMVGDYMTVVTVMAMQLVPTPSQLALSARKITSHII